MSENACNNVDFTKVDFRSDGTIKNIFSDNLDKKASQTAIDFLKVMKKDLESGKINGEQYNAYCGRLVGKMKGYMEQYNADINDLLSNFITAREEILADINYENFKYKIEKGPDKYGNYVLHVNGEGITLIKIKKEDISDKKALFSILNSMPIYYYGNIYGPDKYGNYIGETGDLKFLIIGETASSDRLGFYSINIINGIYKCSWINYYGIKYKKYYDITGNKIGEEDGL